jgi:hypothetical protein
MTIRFPRYLLPILVILNCSMNANAQSWKITEIKKNTEIKKFNKILLIGEGNMASRFFLENLSEKIMEKLIKLNIECDYKFIEPTKAKIEIRNYMDKKYKGYIYFNPQEYSKAVMIANSDDFNIVIPPLTTRSNASIRLGNMIFKERYEIFFFENSESDDSIWNAELEVNFDFSEERIYKKITRKLILALKNNYLISDIK